ncbi:MAG: hypothetical protein C0602_05150 [Denitrovibrio sp.]|nr:MAG: hypothetical protein C0602_05150 [Denitrovibrio sp.]
MTKYIVCTLLALVISCANVTYGGKTGSFLRHQVHNNTVLERFVMQPKQKFRQKFTLPPFRLTEEDFLTLNADLNNDGIKDIIGTLDNFKFQQNGAYPLYILIANDYSFHKIETQARTQSFDIKVLDATSNGFNDISVDGNIIKYDGDVYK